MGRQGRTLRGWTLTEILVVVAVIVLLLGMLVPSLARVRESARNVRCISNLHQWGLALACYLNNNLDVLPGEGASGANDEPGTWYNELPAYANAARYGDIYTGSAVGAEGGYSNKSIWYCPTRLLLESKNSGSTKNSFHYAMNAVLDGAAGFGGDAGVTWTRLSRIREAPVTPFLVETDHNMPAVSPDDTPTQLARRRHFHASSNVLFIDQHVESLPAADLSVPVLFDGRYVSAPRGIVWGPFN